jgi:hypothetical protein
MMTTFIRVYENSTHIKNAYNLIIKKFDLIDCSFNIKNEKSKDIYSDYDDYLLNCSIQDEYYDADDEKYEEE